ncbi:MAG: hypothetical protein H6Q19_823 [Bacteroidetes bacterium]|nr:hypothetical protein [Bacteroidota bacterium]
MKKSFIILIQLIPLFAFSQINESFSDGNFTQNPVWTGTVQNFRVNSENQLQSQAAATSKSYLSTQSEAFEDAIWEFWVKITYTTSSSNYASVYLISDRADVTSECYGYYVQIGNANDEISLYRQEGATKTKIIDGTDKLIDVNPVEVRVKVTRDKSGKFTLYRKLSSDNDYVTEGEEVVDNKVQGSKYFSLLYSNSSTTGNAYFFDDISVAGEKLIDVTPPVWTSLSLIHPDKLILTFSEPIDFTSTEFQVDNGIGSPSKQVVSADKTTVELTFTNNFEKGKIYVVDALNIKDFAGNVLENTQKQIGLIEPVEVGDLSINEILFEPTEDVPEYFEIFNNSDKVLDVSKVFFGTRKTDGSFIPANNFPPKTLLLPRQYLALTPDPNAIRNRYQAPDTARILNSSKWSALNNSSAALLITNSTGDTIYDEVKYDVKWHHPMVRITAGVSLERINPSLPAQNTGNWHSAASEVQYGTPGYKNSQYRDISSTKTTEKWVRTDPESFTPDNDGIDDVCFIRYITEANGFIANAVILNSVGVKVRQVAANQLLSTDGFFTWDGRTDTGKSVNPGIYIIYFELINANSGVKKTEKIPVVVSAR